MSPKVLKVLLKRIPAILQPARLPNYRKHPVNGVVFPGMIPSDTGETNGIVLEGLSMSDMNILDWFEADEYERREVEVQLSSDSKDAPVSTQAYIWCNPSSDLDLNREWNYEDFVEKHEEWYLTNTVRPCRVELTRLGM